VRSRVIGVLVAGLLAAASLPALADHSRWPVPAGPGIRAGNLWVEAGPGGGLVVGGRRGPVVVLADGRNGNSRFVGDGWYGSPPPADPRWLPPGQRGRFAPGWDARRYPHPRSQWQYGPRDDRGWGTRGESGWDPRWDNRWDNRRRDDRHRYDDRRWNHDYRHNGRRDDGRWNRRNGRRCD
jgi:hypothetical protein